MSPATVIIVVVDGSDGAPMPDLRTILRSLTPAHALRNARREVVEHARVVSEIDAIVQRLPAASGPEAPSRITELAAAEAPGEIVSGEIVSGEVVPAVATEAVVEDQRAS
ncbi:MAG TPA: hypothetical protein VGO03_13965 [Acidimicrobiia bacterium]|jgi:hypothetical protein